MNTLYNLTTQFAYHRGEWGHAGSMWWWGPLIPVLWIAFMATVIWFVARTLRPRERSGFDRAREILAERYARGELTGDEYRERLDQLR